MRLDDRVDFHGIVRYTSLIFVCMALFGVTGYLQAEEPAMRLIDWEENQFSATAGMTAGKIDFEFDMPSQRVNWNAARWSWAEFSETRDLSSFKGVEIAVETARPRNDAGVYLAIREDDGTWYYHPWAAQLAAEGRNTYTALFRDFHLTEWVSPPKGRHFDDNNRLDLDKINAVAIGVINPLGIGKVSFSIHALNLIPAEEIEVPPTAAAVSGNFYKKNHTANIPAGLFGSFNLRGGSTAKYRLAQDRRIHHTGVSGGPVFGNEITHMMINAVGDRMHPSPRLRNANWEEISRNYGRSYGEKSRESEFTAYVEYWNEPYLNWANRNRANFIPRFYDVSRAKEGGPVHIQHDGSEAPYLRWTKDFDAPPWQWTSRRDWRRGRDSQGQTLSPVHAPPGSGMNHLYGGAWQPHFHPPEDVPDGETYTVNGRELTAFTPWHIYDETQFTYWSGKGQLKLYIEPMLAFGEALKEADPEAVYMVGWGFRPSEDHWAAWDMLFRPVIDAAIHIAEGVVDHDYGGDPRRLAANYEVVTHYGMTEHDKWLYSYNTETAMGSDPQAYPEADVVSGGTMADIAKRMWTSRKILHALRYVPDKARSFAHFGHGGGWFSDSGEGVALMCLRNLRGRMLHVENDDPDFYIVAAIDGTDPLNPRPADMPKGLELVVAVLNDHLEERNLELTITAPAGTAFSDVIIREPQINDDKQVMAESNITADSETEHRFIRKMPARHMLVLTLPLQGTPNDSRSVVDHQFFGGEVLQRVSHNNDGVFPIAVDTDVLNRASHARLRFVAEHLVDGAGVVVINGNEYPLPSAIGPENSPYIREVILDKEHLAAENSVVFKVTEARFAGYLTASASLIVTTGLAE